MKKEIAKNVSSGAEKVERIEKREEVDMNAKTPEVKQTKTTKTTKKKGTMSASTPNKTAKKKSAAKTEKAAADRRIEAARGRAAKKAEKRARRAAKKASLKEAKLEKKAALKEKKLEKKRAIAERKLRKKEMLARKKAERAEKRQQRKADLKARKAERRQEHIARREMLKNESRSERRQRIAREKREKRAMRRKKQEAKERARENKLKARERAHERKAAERRSKRESRKHAPGFGGWLAAVISLGAACLVLATIVTAGAFRMNDFAVSTENGYRSTLYEMVSTCEGLDDSLSKLRVSSGAEEQRRLLTETLVNSSLLEADIERMPVDEATVTDISGFVNRTNAFARRMLQKLAAGERLNDAERETVAHLYEVCNTLYLELNTLVTENSEKELKAMMEGKGNFGGTIAEMKKGMEEISDAPFQGEGNIGENRLARLEEISSSEAEELAKEYFASYHVTEAKYTGETLTNDVSCYNVVLTDDNGLEIFAEITKRGGKLAFFDTYEECTQKNFDLDTCDAIAREYLAGLGIGDVEAVWLSDGGMVANLTYTTVDGGVRLYPEIIRVRVCEEKGRVVGMDARGYLLNHRERDLKAGLDEGTARGKLSSALTPEGVELALIPESGREVLCYEYFCKYGDEEYLVYLDAATGEEVQILRILASARGSYLR